MEDTETNIEPKDVYAIRTLSRMGDKSISKLFVGCILHL